jgi:hypothetical protein
MKYREGQYNKASLLTFNDGCEVVAKLPNPNAGPKVLTTASEVATMGYVSSNSSVRHSKANIARHEILSVYLFRGC